MREIKTKAIQKKESEISYASFHKCIYVFIKLEN